MAWVVMRGHIGSSTTGNLQAIVLVTTKNGFPVVEFTEKNKSRKEFLQINEPPDFPN
jgi:hypothetical protein